MSAETGTWIPCDPESDFSIRNLPYGVVRTESGVGLATRVGETVVNLAALADAGLLERQDLFASSSLNRFMSAGPEAWSQTRSRLIELLGSDNGDLRDNRALRSRVLCGEGDYESLLPVEIGDYVDFYSSEHHASNVGSMFRDPSNPLLPNWKHLPVGYNGRASSVVVSGTPIVRPNGQTVKGSDGPPSFGPSKQLDFELEVGFFTGLATSLGVPLHIEEAGRAIFGLVLVNDWSARDIQRWEYAPLGPFLAKTFATSVSPWVVTIAALEPFRRSGPAQLPEPLRYLRTSEPWHFDLQLEVDLQSSAMTRPQTICHTNFQHIYWSMAQQLAHQGSNGTNISVGDLYASGTISGPEPGSYGSMLELAWRGERPLTLHETEETRTFLADGDTVTMRGFGRADGFRVGFGEVSGTVMPAYHFSNGTTIA